MPPIDLVLALCCAVLGGIVGSFLNVVVWRTPAGMSLVAPNSFCPKCKHPIRFFDNIPVFGWIFLRGRCRDCHAPISCRYPLIEALCALTSAGIFLAIAVRGWNPSVSSLLYWPEMSNYLADLARFLQTQSDRQIENPQMNLYDPAWFEYLVRMSCGLTAVWTLFFFVILAMGLIQYDGNKIPSSFYYVIAVLICLVFQYSLFLWPRITDEYSTQSLIPHPVIRLLFACATGLGTALVGCLFVPGKQRLEWSAACLLAACVFGGIQVPCAEQISFLAFTLFGACFLNLIARTVFKKSCPILFLFFTLAIGIALKKGVIFAGLP